MTSSGLFGSSAAASTPRETTTASGPNRSTTATSCSSAPSQPASAVPGASGRLQLVRGRVHLVGVADRVGEPAGAGIDVEGRVEHGGVVPPAGLGAVAVVGVDVDDGHPVDAAPPQTGGRHRGVVQVAAAAEEPGPGVVPGRAADRVRGRRAAEHEVGGGRGRVRGRLGPLPRAGPDRRHGVHGVATELGADRRGRPGRVAAVTPRDGREPVGDRVRRARVVQVAVGHPALVRGPQHGQERRVVDRVQRVQAVVLGGHDRRARGAAGLEEHVGPLGQLVVLDRHAAPHAGVDPMGVGGRRPDDRHAQLPHRAARYREPAAIGSGAAIGVGAASSHGRDGPAPERPLGRVSSLTGPPAIGATGLPGLARLRRTGETDPRQKPPGGRLGTVRRMPAPTPRTRARDLGIEIGLLPTGPGNAITDVPGVLVGHTTVWREEPDPPAGRGVARTGVTAIVPGPVSEVVRNGRAAGVAVLNGAGELTSAIQVASGACSRRRSCSRPRCRWGGRGTRSSSCWPSSSRRSAGTW